jgi:hypothetical protein
MQDGWFYCNDKKFEIGSRPMAIKLLELFCAKPTGAYTKRELINAMYASFSPESKSARFNLSLGQNITKLISRLRGELDAAFNKDQCWIEFLPYYPPHLSWSLYRLNPAYLKEFSTDFEILPSQNEAEPYNKAI